MYKILLFLFIFWAHPALSSSLAPSCSYPFLLLVLILLLLLLLLLLLYPLLQSLSTPQYSSIFSFWWLLTLFSHHLHFNLTHTHSPSSFLYKVLTDRTPVLHFTTLHYTTLLFTTPRCQGRKGFLSTVG